MEIAKNVEMPIKCSGCRCNSYMNNLKVRELSEGVYLLKGSCIVCTQRFNVKIDEPGYRELKIQIILDSE